MRKTVLITGGTRGIGKATAIKFAEKNYNIIINYLKNNKIANELKKYIETNFQVDVFLAKADISKEKEVKILVKTVLEEYNKIDVLVNNAGIIIDKDFKDKNVTDFELILNTNLIGTFLVSKYIGDNMKKQKYGKIINVSSTNGINSYCPTTSDYDASKAGVISLTKNLAVELSPYINVNSVAPGWVDTDMNKDLPLDLLDYERERILLKRFASPKEIANVIYFLASDEASYINGETIVIDGGY